MYPITPVEPCQECYHLYFRESDFLSIYLTGVDAGKDSLRSWWITGEYGLPLRVLDHTRCGSSESTSREPQLERGIETCSCIADTVSFRHNNDPGL